MSCSSLTEKEKAKALTEAINELHKKELFKDNLKTWSERVVQSLYTPKKGDDALLFYHSRLPIEFPAAEWFIRYPADEFDVRLDYLTLTAYAELKEES